MAAATPPLALLAPNATPDERSTLAREYPDAILAPGDCQATSLLDHLGGRLPLPTVPLASAATIDILDDKAAFHRFCSDHGLPVPASLVFATRGELAFDALAGILGVPFVVKPTRGSGSVGVVVVRSRHDLDQLAADLRDRIRVLE